MNRAVFLGHRFQTLSKGRYCCLEVSGLGAGDALVVEFFQSGNIGGQGPVDSLHLSSDYLCSVGGQYIRFILTAGKHSASDVQTTWRTSQWELLEQVLYEVESCRRFNRKDLNMRNCNVIPVYTTLFAQRFSQWLLFTTAVMNPSTSFGRTSSTLRKAFESVSPRIGNQRNISPSLRHS